jgi:hypothetical protein
MDEVRLEAAKLARETVVGAFRDGRLTPDAIAGVQAFEREHGLEPFHDDLARAIRYYQHVYLALLRPADE